MPGNSREKTCRTCYLILTRPCRRISECLFVSPAGNINDLTIIYSDFLMKQAISLLILCLVSFALSAQSRFSYSVELSVGAGVWKGPYFTIAPEVIAQYDLGAGFKVGAGTGVRFAMPCFRHNTREDGTQSRDCSNELEVPVFLRLGYGVKWFYLNFDAGYAIGIFSVYGSGWEPGGKKDPCYNGFFFEPQLGGRFGRRSSLALGLLWQQSRVQSYDKIVSGTPDTPSYSESVQVRTHHLFTPAITLRYGVSF